LIEEQQTEEQPSPVPPERPSLIRQIPPIPFAILSLCIVFFLYQIVGGLITLVLFKTEITEQNVQLVRWSTLIGQILFILLPTIVLAKLRHGDPPGFFRIKVPDHKEILLSTVAVFALQQLLQGYMMFQDSIPLPSDLQKFIDQFKHLFEETYRILVSARSPLEFLFVVLVVALTPAICEELLFRGLIQRSFEAATTGMRGAVITGFIFAMYHLNPFSLVPLAALGVYFGFLVHRSGNLTVAVSAHFFNNFLACAAAYMQMSDDFVVVAPGGNPTVRDLFINNVVFVLVFLAATYYFVRVTEPTVDTEK
jgi:hypothetical protein